MRLVAWNANFNNRQRSFADTVALLAAFHADVLVISETSLPEANSETVHMVGGANPGLAVVTVGHGYRLSVLSPATISPDLTCLVRIAGPAPTVPFVLAAVWPVNRDNRHPYHETLMQTLERYGADLRRPPAIMAGDLNSSTRVKDQAQSHSLFLDAASAVGLESVYHHHAGEEHGAELLNTYAHGKKNLVLFHIDYCFVSRSLLPAATVTIPQSPVWTEHSDHYPLVLDIPDSAMRAALPGEADVGAL